MHDSAPRHDRWWAYAAAAWAAIFAVFHVIWAAGWYVGLADPEGARIAFAVPWKYAYALVATAMCVIAVPVALAPVMRWGRRLPRGLVGCIAWVGTSLIVLRAGASLIQVAYLIAIGRFGGLSIWEPWFYLGAVLFGVSTWRHWRPGVASTAIAHPDVVSGFSRTPSTPRLEAVLLETRALLARPGNDFSWSSWRDQEAALAEIDELIAEVRRGGKPDTLDVLFLPAGPIQEVSLSSGWAQEFLDLANRYDQAAEMRGSDQPAG